MLQEFLGLVQRNSVLLGVEPKLSMLLFFADLKAIPFLKGRVEVSDNHQAIPFS